MDILVCFGKAVKLRRVEVDLTQEALADKAGLARSFVSGIERGATKASIESVWRLANALDCSPSDLWVVAERLYFSYK
ncbi:helix-turn-helix domain-containing protein [Cellvibrio sp. PSBB006]|uniref:helix-turn-helix domain-containing protein n=1 Tax=Cellvibrio sp. PSBB006 TaxID=1987723 RepID=UPI000B3B6BB4|nr:transcriptional regulator [Cellvibrio sp. PSBB006]